MSRPVVFAGMEDGHLRSGELVSRAEVDEFVLSCISAGWTSVVVVKGAKVLRKWRRATA